MKSLGYMFSYLLKPICQIFSVKQWWALSSMVHIDLLTKGISPLARVQIFALVTWKLYGPDCFPMAHVQPQPKVISPVTILSKADRMCFHSLLPSPLPAKINIHTVSFILSNHFRLHVLVPFSCFAWSTSWKNFSLFLTEKLDVKHKWLIKSRMQENVALAQVRQLHNRENHKQVRQSLKSSQSQFMVDLWPNIL